MLPTITQLRGWNPHLFTAAGDSAQAGASSIRGAATEVSRAMDSVGSWTGFTHDAADQKVAEEYDHANEVSNVLDQIADEAKDAGADLTHARSFTIQEVDAAISEGFTVSDTGDVTHPDEDKTEAAATYQANIKKGLGVIDELDETYGARLDALKSDLAAMVNGQSDITLMTGERIDPDAAIALLRTKSPDERRAFLAGLSEQDRRRLMQADPATIGNMDGVDFDLRADANEINIRTALAEEVRAGRGNETRADRLREFLGQRNEANTEGVMNRDEDFARDPRGRIIDVDDLKSERRFLAFSNTENGHFIEMIGTIGPGTHNAAVYVPGTGSNLNGSQTNTNAAWDLARATDGPVFVYMNGDLPQEMGHEGLIEAAQRGVPGIVSGVSDHPSTAASATLAKAMAPQLVAFGKELDLELAEHASPDVKTTYVGHSYGGSVVGSAEQLGLNADRVIYASSAGTGAYDGPWANPNANVERYSLTAPGDIIHHVQDLPGNPHGGDPDDTPGVTRLDTGYYSDKSLVEGPSAHGGYWNDKGSTAFQNMAAVIRGEEPTPYVDRRDDKWGAIEEQLIDERDGAIRIPGLPPIPFPFG